MSTKYKSKKELLAEKLYKQQLSEIKRYTNLGDKTTYLDQLNGVAHDLLGCRFKGVYPSDKIPKLNDLAPYCILNLDSSKESGSHWIALAKNEERDHTIIYDSFGRHNYQIIPKLRYSGNGRILDSDRDSEQRVMQTDCGQRCISWLCIYDKYGEDVAKLI